MCGRFTEDLSEEALEREFNARLPKGTPLPLHFNGAPSQKFPIITNDNNSEITIGKWGLVPVWADKAKKPIKPMINARAETVQKLASFRNAFKKHRCLVPATSFFEWDRLHGTKIPYRIFLDDFKPFAFAGIFEIHKDIPTFSLITTDANILVHQIHDRMPVILEKDEEEKWLFEKNSDALQSLLDPFPPEKMDMYQISSDVNKVSNDTKNILKQVSS